MTNQHPISVPQELLNQWCRWKPEQTPEGLWRKIADNAAQWGADVELEKCCEWLDAACLHLDGSYLRSDRRPKPPSLKEQALTKLTQLVVDLDRAGMRQQASILEGPIRRAVESIND